MAKLWHKTHHNPTIQCSFPQGIKFLRDPNMLTGFSCPGGREDTIPVTRTTDSTGALDKSFFTWECACKKMTMSHRNSKNKTNAPCSRALLLKSPFESRITPHKPEETAVMFLLQCQIRALITLKSTCESEHSVWQSTSPCSPCLMDPSYQRKNENKRDSYLGSTYLILWKDDLGQSLEIPQNQKQALSDPWKTQKEKHFFQEFSILLLFKPKHMVTSYFLYLVTNVKALPSNVCTDTFLTSESNLNN